MKKVISLFAFFVLLLASCATIKEPGTALMNKAERIQYYQERASHYNFLVEQEKSKK